MGRPSPSFGELITHRLTTMRHPPILVDFIVNWHRVEEPTPQRLAVDQLYCPKREVAGSHLALDQQARNESGIDIVGNKTIRFHPRSPFRLISKQPLGYCG